MTKKIILESPFSNADRGKFNANYFYLCLVARKLMVEQEASPLFFHALYTQFLHDNVIEERNLGLFKSFEWHTFGDCKLYAIDRGISAGMILGAEDAIKKGMPVMFFTAMPVDHEISKRISEINSIEDNQARWNAGLEYVSEIQATSSTFEKAGELTAYKQHNSSMLNDVEECILEFFAPLVDHIRESRHQRSIG
ncbi:hypothetical protein LMH73_004725 [Vibrio splendidus]|nr:hypothetical protein [Vibrio splendidus]MCC4882533.1 hypothetical protein [Vibrio splendidus]